MRERIRMIHGRAETDGQDILRDYNLTVYEGEVLYIQGMEGSGLGALPELFSGKITLQGGEVYIEEQQCRTFGKEIIYQSGIYTIMAEADLVKELSAAENLEIIRWVPFSLRIFLKCKIRKKADEYLRREGMTFTGGTKIAKLSSWECQNLSILKAKRHGASVIILDCRRGDYEGQKGQKLCQTIQRLGQEGISFVILSERYLPLAEIADRIQLLHRGRDLMEWHGMDEQLRADLIDPTRLFAAAEKILTKQNILIGMYDYEWETERGFLKYLECFYGECPKLWKKMTGSNLPPEGYGANNGVVILPRKYLDIHFEAMDIRDNIIMTIPKRISRTRNGFLNKRLASMITEEFFRLIGIQKSCSQVSELSRVQLRILCLYRWEVMRPQAVLIDNPYAGLGKEEAHQVRAYLIRLAHKGIRVCCFSQLLEELCEDCSWLVCSENGQGFTYK